MERMRKHAIRTAAAGGLALITLSGCGGSGANADGAALHRGPAATQDPTTVPGVGQRLLSRVPEDSKEIVAVYGAGRNSPDATVVLYDKRGKRWHKLNSWPAHNARKGWTEDHHEDDGRSPVGVFTLTDAGGVLKNPGSKLPYTQSSAFETPSWWAKPYRHDFDYVIAIDYNRVKGTPPSDPTRPQGQKKGGSIWLHMDHGSGTSACVSLSKEGMAYLLRTLDPADHPVVVMGDRAELKA